MKTTSRREFLGGIGWTVSAAAIGCALLERAGLAALPRTFAERLRFGRFDPLVDWLQATPADEFLPLAVQKLRSGVPLQDLVAAAALANTRAWGGTYYDGYHTLMAMIPSVDMAAQMPAPLTALPVLKVLHRNARFLQDSGHANEDTLAPLAPAIDMRAADVVQSVRARDSAGAERDIAVVAARSLDEAYAQLQTVVRDDMNVHRVVLSWRAYDLLRLTGREQAATMLRQCVRFCVDEDTGRAKRGQPDNEIRALLPELVREHGLERRERGTRKADDAWIERLAATVFSAERAAAARAVASALAEGYDPEDVGAALPLAATQLLLNDPGLKQEAPGKPVGSVHGASTGVHASDAANAWRHIARVSDAAGACATLIAGAYHTAGQSGNVGAEANDHDAEPCALEERPALLSEIDARIRGRDQKGACQAARRYAALGHAPDELFALLIRFAVSEDGALHAEKYFRTAQEEHGAARAPHKPLYLVALTRVMASHFGFPAPGCEEARVLLTS